MSKFTDFLDVPPPKKISVTVSLEPELVEWLDAVANQHNMTRQGVLRSTVLHSKADMDSLDSSAKRQTKEESVTRDTLPKQSRKTEEKQTPKPKRTTHSTDLKASREKTQKAESDTETKEPAIPEPFKDLSKAEMEKLLKSLSDTSAADDDLEQYDDDFGEFDGFDDGDELGV